MYKSFFKTTLDKSPVLNLVLENSYNHIILTDSQGKILYANPAAEYQTGYSKEEMIGKTPSLWGGQMDRSFYSLMWKTIKEEKKPFKYEVKNKKKNGDSYYCRLTILPVMDGKENLKGFVGIEEDITDVKELDIKKTEFISIASHQLRTPLGSMRWNMEMLLEDEFGKLTSEIKQVILQMYHSDLRMIGLVNDLLSVSRIEQGRVFDDPKETDVVDLIKSVAKSVEMEAQKKSIIGELRFGKEKFPKIFIDPGRLREVLHNLFTNAIKYSTKKGKIIVQMKKEKKHLKISIEDSGIGIPKKSQERIFSKYFRAGNALKSENEGTGLGLFIVKSYVEDWGGKIWFKSEVGKGTIFTFTLPYKPIKTSPLRKKIKK